MTPTPTPASLAIDALAVHRLTRLVVKDTLTAPLRERAFALLPPPATSHIHGIPNPAYVLTCEFCASIYIAAAVTLTHTRLRALRPFVYVLAIAAPTAILAERPQPNWS